MIVHCKQCDYVWDIPLKMPMLLGKFVKQMKAATRIGCPKCEAGGDAVLLGPSPNDTVDSRPSQC